MTDSEIEAIFFRALQSPCGVAVATNDPEGFKRKAYAVRTAAREQGITEFNSLSFRTSPTNAQAEVWITKEKEPQAHASQV